MFTSDRTGHEKATKQLLSDPPGPGAQTLHVRAHFGDKTKLKGGSSPQCNSHSGEYPGETVTHPGKTRV